jgi:hypothetical protein
MSINYTWSISQLDCLPDINGKLDYCITAHWQLVGTDGTYSSSVYSTAAFPVDADKPDYTPYADLTLNQVLNWVWASGVDKDAAEAAVAQQIENQINPPIVSPPLPW